MLVRLCSEPEMIPRRVSRSVLLIFSPFLTSASICHKALFRSVVR